MSRISDAELLKELKERFEQNKKSLKEHKKLMEELEFVNKKLQDSEELKSNFLSNIRNEIVNPLTTLMGLSKNLLLFDWPNKESVRDVARTINAESMNLDFQLKNIFTAAEIEAGELMLSPSNIDINNLIDNVVDSIKHKITEKKIDLIIRNSSEDNNENKIFIKTDAEKLHSVLINLLLNAVEFSHLGGKVEIELFHKDSELFISVKDYGIGIDKWDQEKIFDRFRQLETGSTKKHLGHGLGLSVVQALMDLLGGGISVESVKQKGSKFTIKLNGLEFGAEPEFASLDGDGVFFEEEIEF
jgi:signal transduction histidine kinase